MATFINEPSHTFNEYLLIPGYSSSECIPANVSLKTPLVKYNKRAGEKPAIEMNIPMISAIMQSVSGDRLAVALNILRETAQDKQVILFTCQEREKKLYGEKE